MQHSIPEVSDRWADALLAARLLSVFGPWNPDACRGIQLKGIHVRARCGPVLDIWLGEFSRLCPEIPKSRFSATMDAERLVGGLDLAATLDAGRPVFERGLLASIDGGIGIFAMSERAEPIAAALIGEALDHGTTANTPTRIALVAIDEGAEDDERLCTSLADRLSLRLDLSGISIRECETTLAVVEPKDALKLSRPSLPDAILDAFAEISLAANAGSMRLALHLASVSKALAALDGAIEVSGAHAVTAMRLVLGVQISAQPPEGDADEAAKDEMQPDALSEPPAAENENGETMPDPQALQDMLVEAAKAMLPDIAEFFRVDKNRLRGGRAGKAGKKADEGLRGRVIGHRQRPPCSGARPDVIATLRTAAPWQRLRGRDAASSGDLRIRKSDFRYKRRRQPTQSVSIFAVDASGSTALDRLGEAKGAVELLLADCYVRRDEVALIAFRGERAEVLLEPTRSLVRAKRSLGVLPGGGPTPLASGLAKTLEMALALRRRGMSAMVVVLTDGSGNVALDGQMNRDAAARDTQAVARQFALLGIQALVIDISRRERETSRQLASMMQADYCRLPRANAAAMSEIVSSYTRAV